MVPAIPSNYASAITPFVPLGREAVGQESLDLKTSTLKPLEPSADSYRGENRRSPDERAGEAGEQMRLRGRGEEARARDETTDPEKQREQLEQQRDVQEIRALASRDREVRAHEQAHAAIGGKYAGSPQYEFTRGPDGVSYAISGEVSIDTNKVPNDPQATIEKASQIRRAANAPAEPSASDRQVAAEAARMEAEARAELMKDQLRATRDAVAGSEGQAQELHNRFEDRADDGATIPARDPSEVERRPMDVGGRLDAMGVNPEPFPKGQLFDQNA